MKSIALSVFLAACAPVVLGQDSTPSSSAAPSLVETGSGAIFATHVVTVGKELNQFVPDSLTANKGDIIQFQFFPPNHSVGRAEYQQPCIPYEDTGNNKVGFWSGFYPLSKILDNPPSWNLTINDTEPVFLYCAAPGSCINYQMVGVINPNSSVSLATQRQDASQSTYMLAPGQSFPSEGGVPAGDVNPNNSTTETSNAPASTTSKAAAGSSHKLSSGAIAGIVIAGVVVALLVGAVFFLLGRHKTMLQFMRGNQYHPPGGNPPGNQDVRSPQPQMAAFPASASAIPYSETSDYHDGIHASPPYTEHAYHAPVPPPTVMAELPSPGEKKSQEYMEMEQEQHPAQVPHHESPGPSPIPSPAPTPQPRSRPLSFWGRSRSQKTSTSELSADSPTVGWGGTTNKYRPNR